MSKIPNLVVPVKFIGQPASKSFLDEEHLDDEQFEAKSLNSFEFEIGNKCYYWSSSRQSVFKKYEKKLYKNIKDVVRSWYTKGNVMKNTLKRCSTCTMNGDIEDVYEDDPGINKSYEI